MRCGRLLKLLVAGLLGAGSAMAGADPAARAIAVLATLDHAAAHCPELQADASLANTIFEAAGESVEALRDTDAYMRETLALNRSQESYDYQTHCQALLDRHAAELPGLLKRPET